MAPVEAFETLLKDVVQAKRLSASKMGNLTDIAMKSMEQDTQLVSILYRTHKSLQPSAKVSSLYIFDALCRAARHQATKHGIVGDVNSMTGNCATFLRKVEGVLEGLFQDMIAIGSSESKEKTKKILDIWVKGNTFPSHILSRLTDVVEGTEQVSEMKPLTTSDPRTAAGQSVPSISESSMTPVMDPQATLLALLAQAANAPAIPAQTTPNTESGAGLDAAQLAVLQQLTLAQTASNAAPSQPTLQASPPQTGHAYTGGSSYREEATHNNHPKNRRQNLPQSPERVNTYDNQVDERQSSRGDSRGGFRGRWRGEGRRWDDRDRDRYRDREREDRSPVRRVWRSRSRSPPSRSGGRRNVRPYSPPRRPTGFRGRRDPPDGLRDPDKDEFGRDIRPQSPNGDTPAPPKPTTTPTPPPPPPPALSEPPAKEKSPALALPSNHDQMSLTPSIAANTSSSTHSAPFTSNTVSAQSGMENFNPATFDFTSPSAWEGLGKMWQVTHGHLPTMEQLMQFLVAAQASLANSCDWSNSSTQGWINPDDGGSGFATGRGRGGGPYSNGNTRNGHGKWTYSDSNHDTDAVVLGGGSSPSASIETTETSQQPQNAGGGGRMQKVGDKWLFVREPVS